MNKWIKIAIGAVIGALTLYNSIYFQSLDERRAEYSVEVFDAQSFVNAIWHGELKDAFTSAIDMVEFYEGLKRDPQGVFDDQAQALGIGNIAYFKVKGTGKVTEVNENNVILQMGDMPVEIETEFIFGNAIRDASGLIKINDYKETADFNSISEAINDRIRSEVIPIFRSNIEVGSQVSFEGAIELNKRHLDLSQPEVIPITLQNLK